MRMKHFSIKFSSKFAAACALSFAMVMLFGSQVSGMFFAAKTAEAQALRSTRLDARLVEAKSRIVGDDLVESTFKAKVRAYGGDIYLPAYAEDIIWKPSYASPMLVSNAIIPGTATVRIDPDDARNLSSEKGRYILKEYEEVDVSIITTSKVILSAMTTPRLVFMMQLSSIIWRPVVQEFNEDSVGNPLLDVTPLGWETNSVIFFNPEHADDVISAYDSAQAGEQAPSGQSAATAKGISGNSISKQALKKAGLASVFGIFNQLEWQLRGLFLK